MECPSCHSEMPDDSRFCEACGAALPVRCASCGATSRAGARFCSKCGKTLAPEGAAAPAKPETVAHAPPTASAERRQLTVMFCDLVGSTALSARLDPEDMRDIIGKYHRCCAEQITKAGGFVAKYMGDGVLAYFGYPQAHEDDAERALVGALALAAAVPRLRTSHDAELQVRIGIATGLVVVGDLIGEGAAQEQAVVGETPNLAARLQSLAEPGQVLISQSTRRLAGGMFEYRDLGRVTLKGLAEPVEAWQVTGTSSVRGRFEAQHESSLTPLIGREEELELLLRRWRQAAGGEGQVVLLSGEPGIGKSRLTVALQERLQAEPHTRLRYFCSPQHADSALYPIISQLERAAEFERHDTADAKLDKLTTLLGPSAGHERDNQLLAELLTIPTADRYAPLDWSAQRKKDETLKALLRQLELLSRQRPVLMIYEDVHWIDPSTRELLDVAVERVARFPVLLVITFRPEFQPPWIGPAHVSPLSLSRLGHREGMALAGSVAGDRILSDAVIQEIIDRTDGVPLFLEELTKAVTEAGAREGGVSALLSATSVPATLHASLMARLDRLGPTTKEVAQIGAAIGREFSYEVLAAVARKSDTVLRTTLNGFNEAGLVFWLLWRRLLWLLGLSTRSLLSFRHCHLQSRLPVDDALFPDQMASRRLTSHDEPASKAIHECRSHLRVHEVEQRRVLTTRDGLRTREISIPAGVVVEPLAHEVELASEAAGRHGHAHTHGEIPLGQYLPGHGPLDHCAVSPVPIAPLRPPSYETPAAGWSPAGCPVTTCSFGTPSQEASDQAASGSEVVLILYPVLSLTYRVAQGLEI